jgi:hypothetical protein
MMEMRVTRDASLLNRRLRAAMGVAAEAPTSEEWLALPGTRAFANDRGAVFATPIGGARYELFPCFPPADVQDLVSYMRLVARHMLLETDCLALTARVRDEGFDAQALLEVSGFARVASSGPRAVDDETPALVHYEMTAESYLQQERARGMH